MGSPDYINWPTNGPYFDAQSPLAQGCIGAWCLSPNWWAGKIVQDVSPYHAHGTTQKMEAADWTPWGLDFDGVAEYITCGVLQSGVLNAVSWTVFMRMDNPSASLDSPCGNANNGSQGFTWFYSTTSFRVQIWGAAGKKEASVAYGVGLDWTVVSVTYSSGIAAVDTHLYQDGVQFASHDMDAGTITSANPFYIGRWGLDHPSVYMDGAIAAVVLHNRALSENEVVALAADPLRLFRRKEIAYFFGAKTGHVPYSLILGAA